MKREREYSWYVEPLDPETNRIIGEKFNVDSMMEGVRCDDGLRHDLWLCDRQFIARLKKARKSFNLKFNIWVQEGRGLIRPSNID